MRQVNTSLVDIEGSNQHSGMVTGYDRHIGFHEYIAQSLFRIPDVNVRILSRCGWRHPLPTSPTYTSLTGKSSNGTACCHALERSLPLEHHLTCHEAGKSRNLTTSRAPRSATKKQKLVKTCLRLTLWVNGNQ